MTQATSPVAHGAAKRFRPAPCCRILCCWILLVTSARLVEAQVQLDRFFPSAVTVGQQTKIKAEGKFPAWPPQIFCDRPDVTVTAAEKSGEFNIEVKEGASPGAAWIRVYDDDSASGLVPLLVEPVIVTLESEANNKLSEAMKLESPSIVSGRLEKSGDLDTYQLAVLPGQTLVVSLIANRILRSPMDTILQLTDGSGNVLAQTDDDRGLDPQIVYPCDFEGIVYVRVFAFPETPNSTIGYAGGASFVYLLKMTTGGMLDHVLPLVQSADQSQPTPRGWNLPPQPEIRSSPASGLSPNTLFIPQTLGWHWQCRVEDQPESIFESMEATQAATAQHLPFVFSGHLDHPGEIDRVRFPVAKGGKYRVTVESKRLGFLVDSVIRLVSPADSGELAKNDDRARNQYDAALDYTAKEDGEIELQISDLVDGFGPRHAYSALVTESQPDVEPTVSEDHFLVKSGADLEIAVNVNRLRGFAQRLEFSVEGLPKGVTTEPIVSESKGDSAKTVKLKLSAKDCDGYQGPFRIVAKVLDDKGERSGEPKRVKFSLREEIELSELWLTVAKKSES